ncbi:MAG: LysR family transcriptional regulator [Treponema sp.]|nr:LysR family transcriptional regulator [Treponema sp.]
MTIQQIKYILGVAENGSLNKAAEKLSISQPSLTASIHDAESELGFDIFKRSSRGVSLTGRGESFVSDARKVYKSFENLLKKYGDSEEKTFSVATLYYAFARKAFVEVVKEFSPMGWDFAFREMKAVDVIADVALSKSNIGIFYMSDSNKNEILRSLESNHLDFHHLTECNAFVYLHRSHPLAEKESISLDDLSEFQFVTFDTDDVKSFFSEEVLSRHELKKPIMVADRATELNLLKKLNGYTFLSGVSGEDTNEEFITVPLKIHDGVKGSAFELGYITQKNIELNDISLAYIDAIQRILDA